MCPKCSSNKVIGSIIDDDNPKQPIWHFVCETCDQEWVE